MDSALQLFRERGFDQTTMRQIAAAAGVAVGGAYYYFESKEALIMAFYEQAQQDMEPGIVQALTRHKGLEQRLRALLDAKFDYFEPNRSLLGALSGNVDPLHPLSPFSEQTKAIRDKDIGFFAQAIEGGSVHVPDDLRPHLPGVLWMYQMGLLLFWVYDRSTGQVRTRRVVDASLKIVVSLIKLSGFPLMRPVRKTVIELLTAMAE